MTLPKPLARPEEAAEAPLAEVAGSAEAAEAAAHGKFYFGDELFFSYRFLLAYIAHLLAV